MGGAGLRPYAPNSGVCAGVVVTVTDADWLAGQQRQHNRSTFERMPEFWQPPTPKNRIRYQFTERQLEIAAKSAEVRHNNLGFTSSTEGR